MARLAKNLLAVARDVAGLGGLGAITYGTWLIYHPAGYIVGGLFAVTGTVLLTFLDQKAQG